MAEQQRDPATAGRNLVLCLDGTNNEPETGSTNVARMYDVAAKDSTQLVFYDPGVGTMGARGAITSLGRKATRVAGLAAGYGIRENLEEAYTFLMRNYRPGDRIFVFGFSRGAYTARALTGMLRTVGLLHQGVENLVPYAVKLYAQSGGKNPTREEEREFWKQRDTFVDQFGNSDFPNPFDPHRSQVHFLGVWDTVKSVGWLNWRAQIEQARWPFTAKITNVATARHALALDERRRPYREYRFDPATVTDSGGRHLEMWFAGVHSDVGGQFPDDHALSDIAFAWMVEEARGAGLEVEPKRYRPWVKARLGDVLPPERALGRIHPCSGAWRVLGGWRSRPVRPEDAVHPSVLHRVESTANDASPYRPELRGREVRRPGSAATPD